MALWKREKKTAASEETPQKDEILETAPVDIVSTITTTETSPEKLPEFEGIEEVPEDMSGGVILYGKKINGFFKKSFWGLLTIFVFPPILTFALSILVIISMLIFPLLGIILVATIPVVLVTLFIFVVALPVLFPLLVIFLLITGKGRLLIGSEGKWFGLEMFGKQYTLK